MKHLFALLCCLALLCPHARAEEDFFITLQLREDRNVTVNYLKAENGYYQISQEEARRLMDKEAGFLVLDVRREDEFAQGHIPGAICVPNESIGTEPPPALEDKAQLILVYCRSGRRSKEAAEKLAAMGYVNVLEFGGIITWTGEITQ